MKYNEKKEQMNRNFKLKDKYKNLKGLGGWLSFFTSVFYINSVLGFIVSLGGINNLTNSKNMFAGIESLRQLLIFDNILMLVLSILFFYITKRVRNLENHSAKYIRYIFITFIVYSFLRLLLIIIVVGNSITNTFFFNNLIWKCFATFFWFSIFLLYFIFSKRVKVNFPEDFNNISKVYIDKSKLDKKEKDDKLKIDSKFKSIFDSILNRYLKEFKKLDKDNNYDLKRVKKEIITFVYTIQTQILRDNLDENVKNIIDKYRKLILKDYGNYIDKNIIKNNEYREVLEDKKIDSHPPIEREDWKSITFIFEQAIKGGGEGKPLIIDGNMNVNFIAIPSFVLNLSNDIYSKTIEIIE